jgi:hypothetical protein
MRSFQTIHFFLAVGLAAGLLSVTPSYAKNLNLQNQNHVGHCDVAGNCRSGHTGTSQPTNGLGGLHNGGAGGLSSQAAGGNHPGGHSRHGGGGRRK